MQKVFFLSFFFHPTLVPTSLYGFFFLFLLEKIIFAKQERREVEGAYNLLDPMVYGFLLVISLNGFLFLLDLFWLIC